MITSNAEQYCWSNLPEAVMTREQALAVLTKPYKEMARRLTKRTAAVEFMLSSQAHNARSCYCRSVPLSVGDSEDGLSSGSQHDIYVASLT